MYHLLLICALVGAALGGPLDEGRIIGGDKLDIYNAPYQVSIFYRSRHICGGVIINSNYILTAGHCLINYNCTRPMKVYAGINDINDVDGAMYWGVEMFKVHESFAFKENGNAINDIALIKLAKPLPMNQRMLPIKLSRNEPSSGQMMTVTGYGQVDEYSYVYGHLFGISVPIVDKNKCHEIYSFYGITDINEQVICAGYAEGEKDSCQGDSGGPAVSNGELVGIISYGLGCARPGLPGVYTNVAYYIDWINKHLAYH